MASRGDPLAMQLWMTSTVVVPVIQKVIPTTRADPEERLTLEAHLSVMGCVSLLDVAWGVKKEALVA